jgi:hypothetical protein
MSKSLRLLAALICVAAVGACAQPARVSQMTVANVAGASVAEHPDLVGILTIDQVSGGQETNPLWTSEVGNAEFRTALENSLQANALLAASPDAARYRVSAVLEKLEQPLIAFDTRVTSVVSYRVVDAGGATFFEQKVTHPYTASVGDAFYGPQRLQLANEGSIAGNIRIFINAFVEHWRLNRPAS